MSRLNWLVILGATLWAGPMFAAPTSLVERPVTESGSAALLDLQNDPSQKPAVGFLLAQADTSEKERAGLEKRNKELALEYQKIAAEAKTLKAARNSLKTNTDRMLYNDRIEELNKWVREYEKKRAAFEKDVGAFQAKNQPTAEKAAKTPSTEAETEKDTPRKKQAKSEEPAYTDTDLEIIEIRKELQEREKALNQEYKELMEEKGDVERAVAEADAGDGDPVEPDTIKQLNEKIQSYDERRATLNTEIEAYNQKIKKLKEAPEDKKNE